jgi:fumarate hydratase subunit beta
MVEYLFTSPLKESDVRKLKVRDIVYMSGSVFTARDEAHHRALKWAEDGKKLPINLRGLPMYHCGPLARKDDGIWNIISAGPTTSSRMELYESDFIKQFEIPMIVGKGGMGQRTTEAMMNYGAVYAAFPGGTGALAAQSIIGVEKVFWLDLGMPEALWYLRVEHFGPLTIAIDSHGNNLYESLYEEFKVNIAELKQKM